MLTSSPIGIQELQSCAPHFQNPFTSSSPACSCSRYPPAPKPQAPNSSSPPSPSRAPTSISTPPSPPEPPNSSLTSVPPLDTTGNPPFPSRSQKAPPKLPSLSPNPRAPSPSSA